jgi:hypothetical protein
MSQDYFIAVDFHCKYQKVAWLNRATGETGEADLEKKIGHPGHIARIACANRRTTSVMPSTCWGC